MRLPPLARGAAAPCSASRSCAPSPPAPRMPPSPSRPWPISLSRLHRLRSRLRTRRMILCSFLMTQTIAGQIVEKGLGENPDVRETIERHAKQLLPRVRELYPGGIQKAELERISALGTESDRKKFRPGEVVTGVLLERHLGTSLERASHVGDDWIDPRTNTTYDGVLGNMPPKHYSLKGAKTSIIDQVRKAAGKILVDIHQLTDAQKKEVKDFVNTELPTEQFAKIIILE